MSQDRPLLGIALMLGFCLLAPLADAIAKIAGQTVALGPVIFLRFAVQVMLLAPFIGLAMWRLRISRRVALLCFLRTLLHIIAIGFMFLALRAMPLADAVAIIFVLPFLNLALGRLVLGEEVGPRRLGASILGFAGVILVIQPSFLAIGWTALLPLCAALSFSIFMLMTRHISADIDPITLQFVSGTMATLLLVPLLLLGAAAGATELTWHPMTSREWALGLSLGALGTLGHLLMTWSLRFAPSATVSPMQYIEIPFAALIGYALFSEWPSSTASLGIVITMVAGLYIIFHEERKRRLAKELIPSAQQPMPPARTAGE